MRPLRILIICLAIVYGLWSGSVLACDICGCFMGVVPYENQSSFGVFHRYRAFNGYQALGQKGYLFPHQSRWLLPAQLNSGSLPGESSQLHSPGAAHTHGSSAYDYEIFRVTELRLRWFIHPRLEVNALIPFVMNSARMNNQSLNVSSLGDPTFLAGWHLLTPNMDHKLKKRLILGGGLKLPSGNYYALDSMGKRIDVLLQPGSGSVDGLGYAVLALGYGKWGMSMNAMAKINGENYFEEKYATGLTGNAQVFYRLGNNPNFSILPQLSLYAEHTDGAMYRGEATGNHRMSAVLGGPGADIFWKKLQFSSGLQFPIASQTGDHTANSGRIFFGITCNLTKDLTLFGNNAN